MSEIVPTGFAPCRGCGRAIHLSAQSCPHCGAVSSPTEKRILPAALLCFFFGMLGIHRFYVGKIGTGLLWLFTLGFLGIGAIVDFILIISGAFRDKAGNRITLWT